MNIRRIRLLLIILIFTAGACLIWVIYKEQPRTVFHSTLAPAYQLFGKAPQSMNRALTRIMPINALDEKRYGEAIALRYEYSVNKSSPEYIYLNDIMNYMSRFAKKPFTYRVYILPYSQPNAFALPGGIICVTQGLLKTLKSESELVSVLAHEMGHIELSHCLEIVRFQLLTKKMGNSSLGKLADFAVNIMLRHTYSKTHEDEADEYAYALILNTVYDPLATGNAFASLLGYKNSPIPKSAASRPSDPVREYFMTHPYLELRSEKFREKGRVWWEQNKNKEKKYVGKQNLDKKVSQAKKEFADEWIQ